MTLYPKVQAVSSFSEIVPTIECIQKGLVYLLNIGAHPRLFHIIVQFDTNDTKENPSYKQITNEMIFESLYNSFLLGSVDDHLDK